MAKKIVFSVKNDRNEYDSYEVDLSKPATPEAMSAYAAMPAGGRQSIAAYAEKQGLISVVGFDRHMKGEAPPPPTPAEIAAEAKRARKAEKRARAAGTTSPI